MLRNRTVETAADASTPRSPETTSNTAVQYCSSEDRRNAITISKAFDWPILHACAQTDLRDYDRWVLVGGQYANPIYEAIFGDALSDRDEGYIVVRTSASHNFGGRQRDVWGIAGWSETDTLQAAAYVIEKGLPSGDVRIKR